MNQNIQKRIFTFWEPKDKMPGYLHLCIETWKKFLPEYEIVILDYSNLDEWLGKDFYDKSLYRNFALMKQADAIRCALLNKYGGVWFDADTIVTGENARETISQDFEVTTFGWHIGFIVAMKNATILQVWEKKIKEKIFKYKIYNYLKWAYKIFNKSEVERFEKWDYLGNSILNPHFKALANDKFLSLNREKVFALPEIVFFKEQNLNELRAEEKYRRFYFQNDYHDYILNRENSGGIISLHNSWTPQKYREMSVEEFIKQDITLARLFNKLLYNQ